VSEPAAGNVLVNFRLDHATPIRVTWISADGTPLDGYKAQVTAIELADGARLAMDPSAILEQAVPDPLGGVNDFLISFTGMVGFAAGHADRARVDQLQLGDEPVGYALTFVHADDGRVAVEDRDYKITDRPKAMARKLGK
jgi:hypothetical protein